MDTLQALHRVSAFADDGTGIEGRRRGRLLSRQQRVDGAALPYQEAGKEGLSMDPKRGTGISCAGGPSQLADHSSAIPPRHGIYPLVTRLLHAGKIVACSGWSCMSTSMRFTPRSSSC